MDEQQPAKQTQVMNDPFAENQREHIQPVIYDEERISVQPNYKQNLSNCVGLPSSDEVTAELPNESILTRPLPEAPED